MAAKKKETLSVKNIRNINVENILYSIMRNKSITRSVLAKENSISLMTVKHIVDDLIDNHILTEQVLSSTGVGRNPKVLKIADNFGNIVCVDLTSKNEITYLIYDIYENLLEKGSLLLEDGLSFEQGLQKTIRQIKEKQNYIKCEIVGAAVFVPGAYDEKQDLINYDLIPDLKEVHLKSLFKQEFGIDNVLVLHDVFAAARSEYDSLNPEKESQFYFYCGYGVGGYYIYQNKDVAGNENMAGEVGKVIVSKENGKYVSLEEIASISAVKEKMKEYLMDISFAELVEQYLKNEQKAKKILAPVLEKISLVLYNLLWAYNPTRIIIDSCKPEYCRLIADYFSDCFRQLHNEAIPLKVEIRTAKYDEYHTMRGCFFMVRNAWVKKIADEI